MLPWDKNSVVKFAIDGLNDASHVLNLKEQSVALCCFLAYQILPAHAIVSSENYGSC